MVIKIIRFTSLIFILNIVEVLAMMQVLRKVFVTNTTQACHTHRPGVIRAMEDAIDAIRARSRFYSGAPLHPHLSPPVQLCKRVTSVNYFHPSNRLQLPPTRLSWGKNGKEGEDDVCQFGRRHPTLLSLFLGMEAWLAVITALLRSPCTLVLPYWLSLLIPGRNKSWYQLLFVTRS